MNPDENIAEDIKKQAGGPDGTENVGNADQETLEQRSLIRTYEGDVAKAIEKKRASVMTIAIAESMSKNRGATIGDSTDSALGFKGRVVSSESGSGAGSSVAKKILYFLLSLILLGAGGAGVYYIYLQSPLSLPAPVIQTPKSNVGIIIPADKQKIVDITDLSPKNTLAKIQKELTALNVAPGNIGELIFTNKVSTDGGGQQTERVSATDMMNKFQFTAPDVLVRSLTTPWMYGVYHGESGVGATDIPFMILTTDFYQNAYAGMLKWEPSIVDDFAPVFGYAMTGTSTPITSFYGIHGAFTDATIQNRDVRIFRDDAGTILLMYAFIDKNTFIITTRDSVLREAITRFEKKTYLR